MTATEVINNTPAADGSAAAPRFGSFNNLATLKGNGNLFAPDGNTPYFTDNTPLNSVDDPPFIPTLLGGPHPYGWSLPDYWNKSVIDASTPLQILNPQSVELFRLTSIGTFRSAFNGFDQIVVKNAGLASVTKLAIKLNGGAGELIQGKSGTNVAGTLAVGEVWTTTVLPSDTVQLFIDTTSPVLTVDNLLTNTDLPLITGTVNDDLVLSSFTVTVNSVVYDFNDPELTVTEVIGGPDTWALQIPSGNEIPEGIYNVSAVAVDQAGNIGADSTSNELEIDLTFPVVGMTFIQTNNRQPALNGTVTDPNNAPTSVSVVVVSSPAAFGSVPVTTGTWNTASAGPTPQLSEGTYNVIVTATDGAGNTTVETFVGALIVDISPPLITFNGALGLINNRNPTFSGTVSEPGPADPAALTLEVLNASNTVVATAFGGNPFTVGPWSIPILTNLADGLYSIRVIAADAANNVTIQTQSSAANIDATPPVVTIIPNPLITPSPQPFIGGTVVDANNVTLSITLNGAGAGPVYVQTPLGSNWSQLINQTLPAGLLPQGIYNITVVATDAAGNVGTDNTTNELIRIDADPEVTGITPLTFPLTTNAPFVSFEVTFNLSMKDVTVTDFALDTDIPDAFVSAVNQVTASIYEVVISTGSSEGTIGLDVLPNKTMSDIIDRKLTTGASSADVYTITPFRFVKDLGSRALWDVDEPNQLSVEVAGNVGVPVYTWYFEQAAGTKAFGVISGATTNTLDFTPFVSEDAGLYYVTVLDPFSGALLTSRTIEIAESAGVPVGGALGLAALSLATALGGAASLRRRNKK
ncbi:MAG: hypothetical protein GC168_12610 [Candidatus Hydrogenedens sp.]|nr:hypothetical protein [Candidatus Hydrogenedens sp.]